MQKIYLVEKFSNKEKEKLNTFIDVIQLIHKKHPNVEAGIQRHYAFVGQQIFKEFSLIQIDRIQLIVDTNGLDWDDFVAEVQEIEGKFKEFVENFKELLIKTSYV